MLSRLNLPVTVATLLVCISVRHGCIPRRPSCGNSADKPRVYPPNPTGIQPAATRLWLTGVIPTAAAWGYHAGEVNVGNPCMRERASGRRFRKVLGLCEGRILGADRSAFRVRGVAAIATSTRAAGRPEQRRPQSNLGPIIHRGRQSSGGISMCSPFR